MDKTLHRVTLLQGEGEEAIHMQMDLDERTISKMAEIASRYPEGYWDSKKLDLLDLADEEMDLEDQENQEQK